MRMSAFRSFTWAGLVMAALITAGCGGGSGGSSSSTSTPTTATTTLHLRLATSLGGALRAAGVSEIRSFKIRVVDPATLKDLVPRGRRRWSANRLVRSDQATGGSREG